MESFDETSWDLLDYSSCFINDVPSTDLFWPSQGSGLQVDAQLTETKKQDRDCPDKESLWESPSLQFDAQFTETTVHDEDYSDKGCPRKRVRSDSCSRLGTKACRERQRRERLNDRFLELSSVLEPGRPPKTDKSAILGDAIRVLNQLRAESREFKEMNDKLFEEIKSLKAEKNELRGEKTVLKADRERMKQQMKAATAPSPGFLPAHPAAYHAGPTKMAVYPSYGFVPMWQYLPPSACDTSQDQELRPPAA